MFLDFYGLKDQPFGVTPDPRYLFLSESHREALASLFYGVNSGRGLLALIAAPGMGKTTLLFYLLEHLQRSARTAYLFQTQCDSFGLLRYLLSDLHIETHGQDFVAMHEKLNEVLLQEARVGRRFVLVIDESQNLDDSVLETARLLSDFETPREKLLQIVFTGQLELADKLARPELAQLRQRIAILSRLEPLSRSDVSGYIEHRLQVAGYKGIGLFTPAAIEGISACTQGIPRNINNVCFGALSLGCALGVKLIDVDLIAEAAADLDMSSSAQKRQKTLLPVVTPVSVKPLASAFELARDKTGNGSELELFEKHTEAPESTIPVLLSHNPSRSAASSSGEESLTVGFEVEVVGLASCAEFAGTLEALRVFAKPSLPTTQFVPNAVGGAGSSFAEVENQSINADSLASSQPCQKAGQEVRNDESAHSLENLDPAASNSPVRACELGRQTELNPYPSKRKTLVRVAVAAVLALAFVAAISFKADIETAMAAFSSYFDDRKGEGGQTPKYRITENVTASVDEPLIKPMNSPDDGTVVTVQRGDSLRRICLRQLGGYDEQLINKLSDLNPELTDLNRIYIGERIILPELEKHPSNPSHQLLKSQP